MPRKLRIKSCTNIYHVTLRGVNRQQIFEASEDYRLFLDTVKRYQKKKDFKVLAYCLMGNHVHLLLELKEEDELGSIMQLINGRFARIYNWKYDRVGHLFQGRYKCETIDNNIYLGIAFRYILQNPWRAGLEKKVGTTYPWSSFSAYQGFRDEVTSTEHLQELFGGKKTMMNYLHADNYDICLDVFDNPNLERTYRSDQKARSIIWDMTACNNISDFQQIDKEQKEACILKMLEAKVSVNAISRLTGTSRHHVRALAGKVKAAKKV